LARSGPAPPALSPSYSDSTFFSSAFSSCLSLHTFPPNLYDLNWRSPPLSFPVRSAQAIILRCFRGPQERFPILQVADSFLSLFVCIFSLLEGFPSMSKFADCPRKFPFTPTGPVPLSRPFLFSFPLMCAFKLFFSVSPPLPRQIGRTE